MHNEIIYQVEYEDTKWYAPNRHTTRTFLFENDAIFFQKHKLLIEKRMATIREVRYPLIKDAI